ncbi:hypothetical protein GN244_ATG19913 [Phytophthora infestans]|uniref:Uncharacterized protein n=1 Tax=Phytophthora infestans TaxID=4787 RepID=A0A833RN59_PHYIN|nr:hypothetical protein GN244_ATG19913 [Phytophthora infestans]
MGAAREKRRAERIVEGGTPTWRQTWSELKASGWTHKKPRSRRGGSLFRLVEKHAASKARSTFWEKSESALSIPPASTNPSRPARYDRIDRSFWEFCYLPCQSASTSPVNGDIVDIRTSKDRDDEFELVPRDRALRPRFSADTSIGTSLFGPSDEDDSDDEVTIFDDDDGDFDNDNALYLVMWKIINKIEGGEDSNDIGGLESDE